MIRVPGYGDHLESTVDPEVCERQKFAPAGFADVIGGAEVEASGSQAWWSVTFTVADRPTALEVATKARGDGRVDSESE